MKISFSAENLLVNGQAGLSLNVDWYKPEFQVKRDWELILDVIGVRLRLYIDRQPEGLL